MLSLAILVDKVIDIYTWIVIASAIMSWLVAFGVVNTRNQFIRMVVEFLYRVTEPALRPIRRIMPNLGGVDISPVILLLLLFFLRSLMAEYVFANLLRYMTDAKLIDGKEIAASLRTRVGEGVTALVSQGHARPGLATVLVGADAASQVYV